MTRLMAKWLIMLDWCLMIIAVLICGILDHKDAACVSLVVGLVIQIVLGRFLRCPKCKKGQGRYWLFVEYCPWCGEPLDG